MKTRIPVSALAPLRPILFNRAKFSGADLARRIGAKPNTVWTWFFYRGLLPSDAMKLADAIDDSAANLAEAARDLRDLATTH